MDISKRMLELEGWLSKLLSSVLVRFDDDFRSRIPEAHGVYRIVDVARPNETIRAGRTRIAARGLRQRLYGNHFMGNQPGNLRAQLVADGQCSDTEEAKRFMREKLAAQFLVLEDGQERAWLEHFMLAVLRPRYCD